MWILCLWAVPALAAAPDTPRLGDAQPSLVQRPYDEQANAAKAVNQAFEAARRSGKRVMIEFGANWCGDCLMLSSVLAMEPVARWADRHFEIATVDVGRFNRNLDLVRRFGLKLEGVPEIVIAAPDGTVLNAEDALLLDSARDLSPQAIVDVLARWAGPRG